MCLEPFDSLTLRPLPMFLGPVFGVKENANPMLLIVSPASDKLSAVRPNEGALPVFLAVLEITLVAAAVVPGLDASALDRAHSELTVIGLVDISEVVSASALKLAVHEVALIVAAVSPFKSALALFLSLVEHSTVFSLTAIVPSLLSRPVLAVI